ncbi:MAG: beta strand repeat-containing protein, partial [Ramlibacter sp.]
LVTRTATDTILTNATTSENITFRNVEQVSFNGDVRPLSEVLGNSLSEFGDDYVGTPGNDSINGLGGNDSLDGLGGDDTIIGGLGVDTLVGGAGNDLFVVDVPGDVLEESASEGADSVNVAFTLAGTYVMGAEVENATVTALGTVAVNVTGNTLDNAITGNAATNTLDGGAGNDTLDGGVGNDILIGGAGDDTYVVSALTDVVNETVGGSSGADTVNVSLAVAGVYVLTANVENGFVGNVLAGVGITGNAGANLLTGNTANNTLSGLDGDDTLVGGSGVDVIDGGNQNDQVNLIGAFSSYTITRPNATDTLLVNVGTGENVTVRNVETFQFADGPQTQAAVWGNALSPFNDTYTGTPGNDSINGQAGNDSLTGLAGNDTIIGGAGVDTMVGGEGNDIYEVDIGGLTPDVVVEALDEGTDLVNVAFTVAGALYTLPANVENGAITSAGTLAVNLTGNTLDNLLTGNGGNNAINGDAGSDTLNGGLGNDTLVGGADDDTLDGGVGNDNLQGGAGNDTYVVSAITDIVNETLPGSSGTDVVNVGLTATGTYLMTNEVENAIVTGTIAGINVTGNGLNNTITGNNLANTLLGGLGEDTLIGGGGTDILDGGGGNDIVFVNGTKAQFTSITRPNATDVLMVSTATGETVTLRGVESVHFSDQTLSMNGILGNTPSAFNDFIVGGAGNDTFDGLAGNDNISGMDGNDLLIGGVGNDILIGGLGNDTLRVDVAGDVVAEAVGEGFDRVEVAFTQTGTYVLPAGAEIEVAQVTSAGTLAAGITGNEFDNLLIGNAGNNILIGGLGNDTLDGGAGNDNLQGGAGDDLYIVNVVTDVVNETLVGSNGDDTVNVAFLGAATYVLPLNVERATIVTGTGGVNVTGNASANTLTGNAANNSLLGLAGNDTIVGGGGVDTIDGGTETDLVVLPGLASEYF